MWHVKEDFRFYLVGNGEPLKDSEQGAPLYQSTVLESMSGGCVVRTETTGQKNENSPELFQTPLSASEQVLFLASPQGLRQQSQESTGIRKARVKRAWPAVLSAFQRSKRWNKQVDLAI